MATPDERRRRTRSFRDALEVDFDPVPDRGAQRRRSEAAMPDGAEPPVAEDPILREPGVDTPLPPRPSETFMRALWALPWAVFAIAVILAGGAVFAIAIAGIGVLCLFELFRMTAAARPFQAVAMVITVGLAAAAYFGGQYEMTYVLLASLPILVVAAIVRGTSEDATRSVAVTLLGIVWIGLALAHAILLRELPEHGGALLLDVLIATVAADTAAYAGGRMFGRHKLASVISPNKTVEGLIFGMTGGALAFWIAGLYQDWLGGWEALAIGLAVAILAPLGDLFESLIKRDTGHKDSGTLVGPHGGLLDRLDAILFTVVAGYYLAVALLY